MRGRGTRAGFSLVEMLVVIAITVILLGLVLGPVIQSFNLTRQANAMVTAQDTARNTLEMISREIGQAMFVYDNSNSLVAFPVEQPNSSTVALNALYGKVDLILPKLVMHCNRTDHPEGQPRDYERGDDAWPLCPECLAAGIKCTPDDVEARPKQPLVPDSKVVRYFVGLADPEPGSPGSPVPGYRDWSESGAPLNGFILYRAEFDPWDENLVQRDDNGQPILDDPDFFYDPITGPHWWAISKPVGPQTDIDLVVLRMNQRGSLIEAVTPSVRFQLAQMTNDAFSPAYITDESAEAPATIPAIFRASYGAWGTSRSVLSPEVYNLSVVRYNEATGSNDIWFRTQWEPNGELLVYKYTFAGGGWSSSVVFNVTNYEINGSFVPTAEPDIAFLVDPARGEARFDFPGDDVIHEDQIYGMNENVRQNWQSRTDPPVRAHRIAMFANRPMNSEFRPRIIPGSEVVVGPDMTPGLPRDRIRMVRYERVPFALGDPGRNQYKIDYGMDDPTGDRVGWIMFSPAYDERIPEVMAGGELARIEIRFKWQCNRDGDIVIGNYSTKTLMNITLGIRYYDRNSGRAHPVELTNKVRVRNLMR